MGVDIRLFGGFQVLVDGRPVPEASWSRRHPAALVKLLALSRGGRLLRDQVIDALWPDLLVEEAAPRLHKAAHYARAALGDRRAVVLTGDTVSLLPDGDLVVDVERFDALAEAARAGGNGEAAARAVELYRGDLLPEDLYEPWTEQARESHRLRYLQLLRGLGRWEQVLDADPADEEAHLQLVGSLVERGDAPAALRQLDVMQEVLERELGAAPGEVAQQLRERALAELPHDLARPLRLDRRAPVPQPPTRTIGRDVAVADVLDLLEQSRIVTLLGPGGVGKTRLAVEVALRWADAMATQACFVDLTKVAEPGQVPELVARELGVRLDAAVGADRVLEEALRGRSALLVLDNFEHVLDAAAVASRLAGCSAGIRTLATSRARLHVSGERVFDVTPLDVDVPTGPERRVDDLADAIVLFEQAAVAVDPGFRLAPHLHDVADICRAVDGLPLAIELAAGHVRTLPPPLLRARLRARLGSPVSGARDLPSRQRTIPATIDWSLQLLEEEERTLFSRLGVFAGPVPLDAVEGVCRDPDAGTADDVLDGLTRLVDHSLVHRTTGSRGEPRFSLLELLREHARELLLAGDGLAVAARHAEYVAGFLDDLDERRWTVAADRWIDTITDALGEVRAAHAWAVQHGRWDLAGRIVAGMGTFWHREGHHAEGRAWVGDARAHAGQDYELLTGRLHLASGFVEWPRDQLLAREHWDTAEGLFRASGNDRYLAYALALRSGTYIGDGQSYAASLRLCDEGIELARRVGERPLIAQALNVKGELLRVQGDDARARQAYQEGLELARAAGDEAHASVFLANLAYLADHSGDYAEALALGKDALRICWRLGRRMMAAWTVSELAGPELGLGRAGRGALLVGAADEALRILEVTRHPGDLSEHERVVTALRGALGERELARLLAEGARLSLEEAVELVLGDTAAAPTEREE